jgi:hypothetical protein
MMAGKPKRSGRKPLGDAPKVNFNTKIDADLRGQLDREAKKNNRSLSREIELRLRASLGAPSPGKEPKEVKDRYLVALFYIIGQIFRHLPPGDMRTDGFRFKAFRVAIGWVLDRLAPSGPLEVPAYVNPDVTPDTLSQSAEIIGQLTAATHWNALISLEDIPTHATEIGAVSGDWPFAMPWAREALGIEYNPERASEALQQIAAVFHQRKPEDSK